MSEKDAPDAYPSSWSPGATRILKIAVIVMGILIAVALFVVIDAEVVSSETDSGRLALVVKTGEGIRVLLIDMRSGRVISVIGGQ